MRGFELVGRIRIDGLVRFVQPVSPDDIVAVSASPTGPMRDALYGPPRARDVVDVHYMQWDRGIGAAVGDYVHVARALGEHAFGTATVST